MRQIGLGRSVCVFIRLGMKQNHASTLERPISVTALAKLMGVGPRRVRKWTKMPGFPIFEGSIFLSDFVDWRKQSLNRGIESSHQPNDVDKVDESAHLNG